MKISGEKVVVAGLGKTGMSVALFLKKRGAQVTVTDSSADRELADRADSLGKMGIKVELGFHNPDIFEKAGLIVLSPGVPHTIGPVMRAVELGVPVIGEIELASKFIKEPVVAISGTNGKTTVTTLAGKMLEESGLNVFVGGNIGNPLIDYVDNKKKAEIIVAEISSFQLDTIGTFRPGISVLLNITKDHLDRYADFNAYVKSKGRIFENQEGCDICIFNASDKNIRSMAGNIRCRKIPFSGEEHLKGYKEYAKILNDRIDFNIEKNLAGSDLILSGNFSLSLSEIGIPGRHNIENVAAAALASLAAGGNAAGIRSALKKFRGLPHRIERVAEINGTEYYDDSKATTVDSVTKALEVFGRPVILIMGGRNKGSDFSLLKNSVTKHVKKLIVLGEAREEIKAYLGDIVDTVPAESMEDSVDIAHGSAEPGDVVLLSPACSSFDMFTSYSHRGEIFRRSVERLKEKSTVRDG
ncbi:MAG: UDP-N-acetylmuramoyl-L-alanine--D-glutamate ligase [Desulfobacterales bacterium]